MDKNWLNQDWGKTPSKDSVNQLLLEKIKIRLNAESKR